METTLQILTKIIADKLEIDPATIHADDTLKELGLDSLDTFDIIFNAEDAFHIKVPNDEVKVNSVQDVADLIDYLVLAQGANASA